MMRASAQPQIHCWTRDEFQHVTMSGIFDRKRVELIEGQVIDMSPMGTEHATAVTLTAHVLERALGPGFFMRCQMPFGASARSEPEPDVAAIAGRIRDFASSHPTAAALVVEVADSSLAYDRNEKGSVYAKAGVADYWIVNLIDRQLEACRTPRSDRDAVYGASYRDKGVLTITEHVAPLIRPEAVIAVADLLP